MHLSAEHDALSVAEGRRRVQEVLLPLPPRTDYLPDNIGATLAEPLYLEVAFPPVDVAAMDGYAVCGAGPWTLHPDIQTAGTVPQDAVSPGQAIRIGTGAWVPPCASAVIRDEHITSTSIDGLPGVAEWSDAPQRDDTRRRGEYWLPGA